MMHWVFRSGRRSVASLRAALGMGQEKTPRPHPFGENAEAAARRSGSDCRDRKSKGQAKTELLDGNKALSCESPLAERSWALSSLHALSLRNTSLDRSLDPRLNGCD